MHGAVGCIAFDYLSHYAESFAGIDFRAVANEVVEPEVGHFAVHHLHIFLSHRYPFRLCGGPGGGGVHYRFAREEYVGLAVFVPFDIGTEVFIFVDGHILLPASVEFFVGLGFKDLSEVMLFAVCGIFGVSYYVSECFGSYLCVYFLFQEEDKKIKI